MKRRLGTFALALAISSIAGSAGAQPSEADKAVAQALFDAARQLTAAKRFAEACPKFSESQRLDPSIGTQYYLADCLEQIGRLAAAHTHFLEAAAGARAGGQKDREEFARKRADAIKPRIPKLTVMVSDEARRADGFAATRDGAPISEVQWGVAIPVDMGAHTIIATAANNKRWEKTIDVTQEGATITVTIPALEGWQAGAPIPPAKPPVGAQRAAPPPAAPPHVAPANAGGGMSGQRIAGIAVGAAGLVGVAVGAAFGAIAISKNAESKADGHCDANSVCDATGKAARLDSIDAATISTVGFIAGGIAVVGGVVLFVTAPKKGAPAKSAMVTAGPGSVWLTGRW